MSRQPKRERNFRRDTRNGKSKTLLDISDAVQGIKPFDPNFDEDQEDAHNNRLPIIGSVEEQ